MLEFFEPGVSCHVTWPAEEKRAMKVLCNRGAKAIRGQNELMPTALLADFLPCSYLLRAKVVGFSV